MPEIGRIFKNANHTEKPMAIKFQTEIYHPSFSGIISTIPMGLLTLVLK